MRGVSDVDDDIDEAGRVHQLVERVDLAAQIRFQNLQRVAVGNDDQRVVLALVLKYLRGTHRSIWPY